MDYHASDYSEDSLEDLFEDDDFIINSKNVVTQRTVYNHKADRTMTDNRAEDDDLDFEYIFEESE